MLINPGVAQSGRAPDLGSGDRRFKSFHRDQKKIMKRFISIFLVLHLLSLVILIVGILLVYPQFKEEPIKLTGNDVIEKIIQLQKKQGELVQSLVDKYPIYQEQKIFIEELKGRIDIHEGLMRKAKIFPFEKKGANIKNERKKIKTYKKK